MYWWVRARNTKLELYVFLALTHRYINKIYKGLISLLLSTYLQYIYIKNIYIFYKSLICLLPAARDRPDPLPNVHLRWEPAQQDMGPHQSPGTDRKKPANGLDMITSNWFYWRILKNLSSVCGTGVHLSCCVPQTPCHNANPYYWYFCNYVFCQFSRKNSYTASLTIFTLWLICCLRHYSSL